MGGKPSREECAIVHAGRRRMQAEVQEHREAKKRRRSSNVLGHANRATTFTRVDEPSAVDYVSPSKTTSRVSFLPMPSRSPKCAPTSPPRLPIAPLWRDTALCFVCRGSITRKRVEKSWQQKIFASTSFLGYGIHLDLTSAVTSGARLVVVVADPTLSLDSLQAWAAAHTVASGITPANSECIQNVAYSKNSKKASLIAGRRLANSGTRNVSKSKGSLDISALKARGIQLSAHSDAFVLNYAVPLAKRLPAEAAPLCKSSVSYDTSKSTAEAFHRERDTFNEEAATNSRVDLSRYPCCTLAEALGLVLDTSPPPAITSTTVSSPLATNVNDRELTYGGYSNEPTSDGSGKPNPWFSNECQQQQQQPTPVVLEACAAPVAGRISAGTPALNAPRRFESTFDGGFRDLRRKARNRRQPRAASLNDLRGAPSSPYLASPRSSEQTPERHSGIGDDFEGQFGYNGCSSERFLDMCPGAAKGAGSVLAFEGASSDHAIDCPVATCSSYDLSINESPRPSSSVSCVFAPDGPGTHLSPITWACQRNGSSAVSNNRDTSESSSNCCMSVQEDGNTVAMSLPRPNPKDSHPHPANLKAAGVLRAVANALAVSESDKGYNFRAAAYRKLANRVQKFPGKLCRADQLNQLVFPASAPATDSTAAVAATAEANGVQPESPKDEDENSPVGYKPSKGRKCGNGGHGAVLSAKMLDRLDVVLRGETRVEVILEQHAGGPLVEGQGSTRDVNGSSTREQISGHAVTLAEAQRLAVRELSGIWGVGNATATMLVSEHGVKGVADLRRRVAQSSADAALLSRAQHIGLDRYDDLLKRMPRAEAGTLGDVIKKYARALLPGVQVEVCGSFRRGALMCGDVDVLLGPPPGAQDFADVEHLLLSSTSPKTSSAISSSSSTSSSTGPRSPPRSPADARMPVVRYSTFLPRLLAILRHAGVLTDDLSNPKGRTSRGHCASYMGVGLAPSSSPRPLSQALGTASSRETGQETVFEPGTYRRIDLKAYPRAAYPFALFYFTGSGHFNRSVRLWAKQHGWSLTDTGLVLKRALCCSVMTEASTDMVSLEAKAASLRSEADIFAALGLDYRTPSERSVDEIETAASVLRGEDEDGDMLQAASTSDVLAADAAHRAQKKYG